MEYGRFRSTSCEQDEALFKSVKRIIRENTNNHDGILETVMLRMAVKSKKLLEYGGKGRKLITG